MLVRNPSLLRACTEEIEVVLVAVDVVEEEDPEEEVRKRSRLLLF